MRQSCVPLLDLADWVQVHRGEKHEFIIRSLICHLCPPQPPPCKRTRRFRSGAARRAEVNSHSFVSGRGRACARPLMRRANLRFSPLCIYRLFARMPIRNYFELCENEHIDNRKVLRSRFLKESLWHWWQSDLRLICGHFSFSGNVFREILGMMECSWGDLNSMKMLTPCRPFLNCQNFSLNGLSLQGEVVKFFHNFESWNTLNTVFFIPLFTKMQPLDMYDERIA